MKKFSRTNTQTSEIFGLVDEALDRIENTGRAPKPKPTRPHTALPRLKVKRSEVLPEMENVELGNVVYVPTAILKSLADSLNVETGKLNDLLLRKLMPLLLSYQTSTGYARAALKEGLNVEIDFDQGLAECVKHIGYLNVVMHYVKNSQLPMSVKRRFINKFSDTLAVQAVNSMVESNKIGEKRAVMDQLQAVVYSRQKDKVEVKSKPKPDEEKRAERTEAKPSTGVRRSRTR